MAPLGYPLEWSQALAPSEAGISLLLALHVPFAALSMLYRLRTPQPVWDSSLDTGRGRR